MDNLDGYESENDFSDDYEPYKLGCHGFDEEACRDCELFEDCEGGKNAKE